MPVCAACAARAATTTARDDGRGGPSVDAQLALVRLSDDRAACRACGLPYARARDDLSALVDDEIYAFTKATHRCPRCRSVDVVVDAVAFDSRRWLCLACAHEQSTDATDGAWDATGFGCLRCCGDVAAVAWEASRAHREGSVVQESHFGVHVARCACGQRFVEVYMERVDWRDGDDDQTWALFPVFDDEAARLASTRAADVERVVNELAGRRRFLVRSRDAAGALAAWWRDGGFTVGPHD